MKRRTVYLILWILLFPFAMLFLLATIALVAVPPSVPEPGPLLLFSSVCTVILAVPLILFLYLWRREVKKDARLEAVGSIIRGYREIRISDLAARLGVPPAEAEALAAEAVGAGHAQGWVDRSTGMFHSGAVMMAQPPSVIVVPPPAPPAAPEVRYCRECGSRVARVPGSPNWQCPSCGNLQ